MAFVSQADRGLASISKTMQTVGPGSYNIAHLQEKNGNSGAPFWSSDKREKCKTEIGPGPGSYNHLHSNWANTLTTYSNSHNIIIKLNSLGTQPFQSKIARFPHDKQYTPGPCDYAVPEQTTTKKERKPRVKSNKLFNAQANAPSISKINYLSERRVKTEEIPAIPDLPNKKGVLAGVWGRDKCKRFQNKCKTEGIGPGAYDFFEAKPKKKNKKGVHGSTAFVSSTVRTFDTIVYDAKNAQTLLMRQLEHYRPDQPAPGSYNIPTANKFSQSSKYKNQTFGSTGQRFGRSKTEETVPFYELDGAFQAQSFLKKDIPFNSESKKMQPSTSEVLPGPGYYTIDRRNSFIPRRSIESFGSTAPRSLDQPKGNDRLGPGCYEPAPRRATQEHQSSSFASKLARPFQIIPKSDKKFAAYELGKSDISHKALEQKIHRQNLEKIHCAKPAFDRQTPRFAHYEDEQRRGEKLTSQQVEYLMREHKEEERKRSIEHARMQAQTRAGTMGHGERWKEGKKGPGVGDYALRSHWTKKSYNIKYSVGQ